MTTEKSKNLQILEAIAVAAELVGTELSDVAKAAMVEELTVYPLADVLNALNRCRKELTGRLTLAAILQRLDTGLPSADEAFGLLVDGWKNDAITVVVPEIAMLAAGMGASGLYDNGDKTGARMAFKAAYEKLAADLDLSNGVKWTVSRGTDRANAETVIMEAVRLGRLPKEKAMALLPSEATESREFLLTGQVLSLEDKQRAKQHTGKLLSLLSSKIITGNQQSNPADDERLQRIEAQIYGEVRV